jgi:hypothetical protein
MREFTPPGCGLVRQMNGLVPCGFSPAVSCVDLKRKSDQGITGLNSKNNQVCLISPSQTAEEKLY